MIYSRMLKAFWKGAVTILISKIKNFYSNKELGSKINLNSIDIEWIYVIQQIEEATNLHL